MGYNIESITITIKDILESYSFPDVMPHNDPWNSLTTDQIIENGKDKFFDFTFPWYSNDNEGLEDFKNLFLRRYYMRQIGTETTSLFKLYMQAKLMEKMPIYKQLYDSSLLEYNPLVNRKLSTIRTIENEKENTVKTTATGMSNSNNTEERTTAGETSGTSSTTNERNNEVNNQSVHSENPEVTVANNDYASSMDREKKTDEENSTESVEASGTENVTENLEGNQGTESSANSEETGDSRENENVNEEIEGFYGESQAEAILKFRETMLNLNKMICDDMESLFLGYYGGQDYGLNW